METKQRVVFFDIFRIFSLLLVIVSHLAGYLGSPIGSFWGLKDFYYVSLGGLGVTLFIILSGMVLEYSYSDKISDLKAYFSFLSKRAKRIYIPFWLAIIVTVFLIAGKLPEINGTLALDLTNTLVFTGAPWDQMIIPAGWFLGVILSLYLVFPLLDYLFHKYNIHYVLIALLIFEIVSRLLVGHYLESMHRALDWVVFCRLFEFGLGIWLIKSGVIKSLINFKINNQVVVKIIIAISALSFPFYIIHWSVLFSPLIVSQSIAVFLAKFFVVTSMFALLIHYLDKSINKAMNNKAGTSV